MAALLDTGFLLAVLDAADQLHDGCARELSAEDNAILPDVVVPELAYLVLRDLGYDVLIAFLSNVAHGQLPVERFQAVDLLRANEVMQQYADNRVDFVDCVIVAMAERLNIRRIMTVDQRHFRVFRPLHCSHFDIVPATE